MRNLSIVTGFRLILASFLGCTYLASCGTGDDCQHSCPVGSFAVIVPEDRLSDVVSVEVSGPCSRQTFADPQKFYFSVSDEGVCHVTVSFRSSPDFVSHVQLAKSNTGCCSNVAHAAGNVTVPENSTIDASVDN